MPVAADGEIVTVTLALVVVRIELADSAATTLGARLTGTTWARAPLRLSWWISSSRGVPAGRSNSSAAVFSRSFKVYAEPARSELSSGSPRSPTAPSAGEATVTARGAVDDATVSIGPSGEPSWVTCAAESTVDVVTQ